MIYTDLFKIIESDDDYYICCSQKNYNESLVDRDFLQMYNLNIGNVFISDVDCHGKILIDTIVKL